MSADDDAIWLDGLSGRGAAADAHPSLREARALRESIRAQQTEDALAAPVIDPPREDRLVERARAAGLLGPAPPVERVGSARPARRWRRPPPRGALAAAAVAGLAIAIGLLRTAPPPAETFRGAAGGTVQLEARDPLALERELIGELGAAGVRATGYTRLGRIGIDADVPVPVSSEVRRVLDRHHIPVPSDGVLVVEIEGPRDR